MLETAVFCQLKYGNKSQFISYRRDRLISMFFKKTECSLCAGNEPSDSKVTCLSAIFSPKIEAEYMRQLIALKCYLNETDNQ